ncbi:hypothetical protein Asp14428_55570 [Actinoplanes sp. NBRC 14428]|uniref:Glycosyl transferase family 2 n=1 Tax=Pseudosporangium ferrugineum TaxID=439699 RepID=A0A2T0S4D7_9ACTN|nr:hypothetical protein [Pseudosporangium ferrugineum]PRY28290.1 hypothetical protein CLV70_10882 [Pseudosporangium ferrugineum]BCJ54082.1 hypothetical protein Asp14428_55570 [Actinoplanes sp. NBRC 14428]
MTDTLDRAAPPAAPPTAHQPSHRHLLVRPGEVPSGDVAAIVVPTIRNPVTMRDALRLGRSLERPVIALSSGKWSSADIVRKEAEALAAEVVAVDVTPAVRLPRFRSDAALPRFRRRNDVSVKRNLGLAVAVMAGWQRLIFIDDDITHLRPEAVKAAGGLLAQHHVAALENIGYPDNSVVCHARRLVGLPQDTFVGGGAMAVRASLDVPFFPSIYNEDWFFLAGGTAVERVALCGTVTQREYDPFMLPERARSEEFGDCLAEGLFALRDDERAARAVDVEHWRAVLRARVEMIDEILGRLPGSPVTGDLRVRVEQALKAARGRCLIIKPDDCVEYFAAWHADLVTWREFLAGLPSHDDPVAAFGHLGLTAYVHRPAP